MDEEDKKKAEGEEQKTADASSTEGDEPTAEEKIKAIEEDTARINKAIADNENAKARQKLGGITEAGSPPEKPKEETDKEYAEKALSGNLNKKG